MLLLHGFGDTPQTLRYLAADLFAHGYDVRVPLLPGHGRTLASFDATPHSEWLAFAKAELMAMRARYPWVGLCGLSMGGALATLLAAEVHDLPVLVLISPYLGMPLHIRAAVAFAPLWSEYVGAITAMSPRSIHDPEEREKNLAYGAVTGRALRELSRLVKLAQRALPEISAPTLLIQSREDNRISTGVAERAFARLGAMEKRLVFTSGAGHIITVDYGKERVFEEVRAWLEHAWTKRAWLGGGPGTVPPEPDVTNGLTPSGQQFEKPTL